MRTARPGGNSAVRKELNRPAETIEDLEADMAKELPDYETAIGQYRELLEASTKQFAGLLEKANEELKASVGEAKAAMEKQLVAAKEQVEKDTPKKEVPESAWVKDHLILNKAAVDLIDGMFTQFREVLQSLSKTG